MAKSRKIYSKKGSKKVYTGKKKVGVVNVKKMISRAIHRSIENKTTQVYDISVDIIPTNNTGAADASVIPLQFTTNGLTCAQGTGQGNRTGNTINLRKVKFTGCLTPMPYSAANPTPCPLMIKMIIFYDKKTPTAAPLPNTNGDMLQYGNTTLPFQNRLTDMQSPFNTDRYHICKQKIFKLGYSSYQGTGINVAAQAQSNNDFKMNHMFSLDITKYCVKRVRFADTATTATTRGLYAYFIPVYADNGVIGINDIPAQFGYSLSATYEDA